MKTIIKYNNELSNIDTEQKAYFLGLMYADGCITKKSKYQLHFRISLTDKQLIDDLHKLFPFLNYEKWDFGKYNKNSKMQYSLRKTSKDLYKDLLKNGMIERKSLENKDFVNLPSINKDLYRHFIRGYFDGDGSISIPSHRKNLRRLEICSVSKNILLQFNEIFKQNNIKTNNIRAKKIGKASKSQLYVMEWVDSDSILKIKEFFYNEATIFLKRKKDLFLSFKKINKRDYNPICPICNTKGCTTKGSFRKMKYGIAKRYYCHNCNKRFTIKEEIAQLKSDKLLENQEVDNQQPIISLND